MLYFMGVYHFTILMTLAACTINVRYYVAQLVTHKTWSRWYSLSTWYPLTVDTPTPLPSVPTLSVIVHFPAFPPGNGYNEYLPYGHPLQGVPGIIIGTRELRVRQELKEARSTWATYCTVSTPRWGGLSAQGGVREGVNWTWIRTRCCSE